MTCCRLPFLAMAYFCLSKCKQSLFLSTCTSPSLRMVRKAVEETVSVIQPPVLGTKNRFLCRFGRNFRRNLLLACETLLPKRVRFPVTSHILAMTFRFFAHVARYLASPHPQSMHIPLLRGDACWRRSYIRCSSPRDRLFLLMYGLFYV